jgi:ABC-2 type transport system permease protein
VTEEEDIYMAVAFTCGLEKVILPFVDRGIPIEYELVRSISTVIQQERKKIGILRTDAPLRGRFNMQAMSSSRDWPIIEELEKQYEVEEVDPTSPITEKYDALLAVQPSSLGPEEMENFLAAVRAGQPTAIFEDPFPFFASGVPATSEEKRPPGGMNPFMRQPPQPKGNRAALWHLLQIDFTENQIVWQDYNPYPKMSRFDEVPEFVFIDPASGAKEPFNDSDPVTAKLQHMLFPFPGAITKLNVSTMEFTPLVKTGTETGTVDFHDMLFRPLGPFGPADVNPRRKQLPGNIPYILAARIIGRPPEDQFSHSDSDGDEDNGGAAEIDVVLVADIDMLTEPFFRLREQGEMPGAGLHFDFDNVTFILNVLDTLAGDDRFIELRKRRPKHRPLTRIAELMEDARKETRKTRKQQQDKVDEAQEKEQKILEDEVAKLEQDMKKRAISDAEIRNRIGMKQRAGQRRLDARVEELEQARDKEIDEIGTRLKDKVRRLQDRYKLMAVVLPPLPPLALALLVLLTRRSREREGVAQSRLQTWTAKRTGTVKKS